MLVKTSSKRCRTDNLEWLLNEIGVKDISEVQGLCVSEFIERYSQKHFSNICLDKLLEVGYVYVPEGEKLVTELPITTRLKNILLRNDVYILSDIVKYSREDIMKFRNLGEETMKELENICEQEGVHFISLHEIEEQMLGVKFSDRQLTKKFHLNILHPEDFLNVTDEDIEYLIQLDKGMLKKIEKMQKLQTACKVEISEV